MPSMIIVWAGLALYGYRHVLSDLLHQWQTNTSYSHGALVIPVALWLLWRRRSTFPEDSPPWPAGLGLLLAAHVLLSCGGYFHLPAMERWTIPLWLSGMIALLWGPRALVWSLPGVCFLAFMIPLPFRLELLASQFLQWASAWCSCLLLGLAWIFAVTDGYTLRMLTGQVAITADCSGLRMTVAIAALGYVITFLSHERSRHDPWSDLSSLGRVLYLSAAMLMVVPVAILANAARIAALALVEHQHAAAAYTAWMHDVGDWIVLPVAAVLLLICRAWLNRVIRMGRAAIGSRRSGRHGSRTWRQRCAHLAPGWRIAVGPVAMAVLASVSFWHYDGQRERIAADLMSTGRGHEASGDWAAAASCYQELVRLQLLPVEASYRHACVSRQVARSRDDRRQVLLQLEALLQRAPLHVAALRTHLDTALELDLAKPALRSAERLYAVDRDEPATLQACAEATLCFSSRSSALPACSAESMHELLEELGPVSGWRDSLVIEVAAHCCVSPDSVDRRLTRDISSAIEAAADRVGSAKANFVLWRFERVFGQGAATLEHALMRVDDECPNRVAYEIYFAAGQVASLDGKPDDARVFLEKAIRLMPADHRAYAQLGDVFASQQAWSECTAAYLRAWRLAGDRPLELGVKLAESLIRTDRHALTSNLAKTLAADVASAYIMPSRSLRLRLQLIQARLDLHAGRCEEARQSLENCHQLAMWHAPSATPDELLPTIETLWAQCLVRLGRYAEAARWFEERAGRMDLPADQWTAAARAWRTAGNADAAARCYRQAIRHRGYSSGVWLEYVRLLRDQWGIDAAAREVARRVGQGDQGEPMADDVVAQAWELVGNDEKAIQHYRSAAVGEVQAVAALAIALARQGKVDRAVELVADEGWSVDTAVRAHTAAVVGVHAAELSAASRATIMEMVKNGVKTVREDAVLLLAAEQWFTKCQDMSAALEMLQRAVAVQPDNVIAANNLAMLLVDEGRDFEQALRYIDDVLRRTGPVAEFLDTRGWILVQMRRAEEALPWLTRAVEGSASGNPVTQLHLATAYLAVGDRDQAWKHLEVARAGQMSPELLNSSEQRAWAMLQHEFAQQAHAQQDDDV